MNESTARNIRVQDRYDELMRIGKHGHYETMFQVVREETESLRQQLASRDAEVANLAALGGSYLNRANAAELELDQLHKNVTLLRDELNTIYKLVPDLVELMKPSALAATEPKP